MNEKMTESPKNHQLMAKTKAFIAKLMVKTKTFNWLIGPKRRKLAETPSNWRIKIDDHQHKYQTIRKKGGINVVPKY